MEGSIWCRCEVSQQKTLLFKKVSTDMRSLHRVIAKKNILRGFLMYCKSKFCKIVALSVKRVSRQLTLSGSNITCVRDNILTLASRICLKISLYVFLLIQLLYLLVFRGYFCVNRLIIEVEFQVFLTSTLISSMVSSRLWTQQRIHFCPLFRLFLSY